MASKTEAYPLSWPQDWSRTSKPTKSQFKTSLTGALKNVTDSLKKFSNDSGKKIENQIISSNVTLGNLRPNDSGVAVYFSWDGISTCIAVDRYTKVEENLQAIHHCIEAERTKLRHGGLNIVRATFRGYAALPPPSISDWWDVLECRRDASRTAIDLNYKRLRKDSHPDRGGNDEWFNNVQQAYKESKQS